MKTLFAFIFSFFAVISSFSQSPNSFKYQAVLRDKVGQLITEKTVSVRISILQGTVNGSSVYTESHSQKTNAQGAVNLEIGKGTLASGIFNSISWGTNAHFIKVEMDPSGGSAYDLVGTSQLLSVPYAMHAQTSGDEKWTSVTGGINYGNGNVGIGTLNPTSKLDIQGLNSTFGIYKTKFTGTESVGKGRFELKNDAADQGIVYSTSLDRVGDVAEDLLFGIQHPIGNTTSWGILESWRGAGLMVSSSGPDLNPLVFGIDRVEKARFTGSGNFGIGISNPLYKLDVNGAVNASQYLINGSAVSGFSPWFINSGAVYYNAGNVGIGTSTPTSNLDIQGLNSTANIYKTKFTGTESVGKGRFELRNDPSDQGIVYSTELDRLGDTSEDLLFGLQHPIGNTTS